MKESKFELKHFDNNEFGQLDILIENGKEYFPAVNIAKILGYKDPEKAITTHCKHPTIIKRPVGVVTGKKKDGTDAIQIVNKKFINEGNLYRLIIKSRLANAEKFENWVFDEVLPSIRKHGAYIEDEVIQKLKDNPNYINELEEKLKQSKDIFDYYNIVHNDTDTQSMADFAKLIQEETGLGRNKLMQKLREKKILRRNNTPYQGYMKYFKVVQIVGRDGKIVSVTRVKNSKQDSLIKLITKDYKKVA